MYSTVVYNYTKQYQVCLWHCHEFEAKFANNSG